MIKVIETNRFDQVKIREFKSIENMEEWYAGEGLVLKRGWSYNHYRLMTKDQYFVANVEVVE